MSLKTEGVHDLEFLLSEANGHRSRENVTITVSGSTAFAAGTVMGKITATGKYVAYNEAGTDDGRRVAAGVLMMRSEAVNGDYKAAVIVRDAEVMSAMLTGIDANGIADLATLGVIVRS